MAVTLVKFPIAHVDENTTLGSAFRKILRDKAITEQMLRQKVEVYATNVPIESDRAVVVNNIMKELTGVDISWKVFTKGLKILGVDDITMLV